MDKVTPGPGGYLSGRVYVREGSVVSCKEIIKIHEGAVDRMISEGKELFRLNLTIETAKILMEDLYYGEYTGG